MLGGSGIPITTQAVDEFEPAVASDGTGFLVVWVQAGGPVRAARVNVSGTVLDAAGITLPVGLGGHTAPAVAFNRSYLVASKNFGAVVATRVTTEGTVPDPSLDLASPTPTTDSRRCLRSARDLDDTWGAVHARDTVRAPWCTTAIVFNTVAPKKESRPRRAGSRTAG